MLQKFCRNFSPLHRESLYLEGVGVGVGEDKMTLCMRQTTEAGSSVCCTLVEVFEQVCLLRVFVWKHGLQRGFVLVVAHWRRRLGSQVD